MTEKECQDRVMYAARVRDAAVNAYNAWITAWGMQGEIERKTGGEWRGQVVTPELARLALRRAQRRDRILKALTERAP